MAVTKITMPDELLMRIVTGFSSQHGYKPTINTFTEETPNPETRAAFMRRIVRAFVIDSVAAWEAKNVAPTESQSKIAEVKEELSDITIEPGMA